MAFILLHAPLKYDGNGPIASPSKVVQNSRNLHSASNAYAAGIFLAVQAPRTVSGLLSKNFQSEVIST
jgi:hypothetical protein